MVSGISAVLHDGVWALHSLYRAAAAPNKHRTSLDEDWKKLDGIGRA
jgi:hypothetical protein